MRGRRGRSLDVVDVRRRDAGFLLTLLDASPGIIFVIDSALTITWANEATSHILGYTSDEVIGRSILEFLDTEWNPEAFDSIGTAMGSSGWRPPTLFRVLAEDGSRPIIEAQSNVQLDDPTIGGVVTYARRWTAQWLLDRTLDSVAAGEPVLETLGLLVKVVGAEPMDAPASFLFDPIGDRVAGVVAAPELTRPLRGPVDGVADGVVTIWAELLREQTGRVHRVDDLAEPLRSLAIAAGFLSLWIWPTDHDREHVPTLWAIAWRREEHLDADQTRTGMMSRLATVGALALARWRSEVANAYAAAHDTMTGLWNRSSIIEYLQQALDPATSDATVAVVYLDLDGFKPVNDRYGHAAGDRVLTDIASRLAAAAPRAGRLGRFGGDEFVYAGPVVDVADIERIAMDLSSSVADPIELRTGEQVSVGVSVGTAFGRPGSATVDDLIERADRGLYESKRLRRARG